MCVVSPRYLVSSLHLIVSSYRPSSISVLTTGCGVNLKPDTQQTLNNQGFWVGECLNYKELGDALL